MARAPMTRDESKQLTRRRLMDAAARVFAKRGYRGASVEEIASEAGYTIGALYSNFSGKEEVLLAFLEQQVARIAERIVAAARAEQEPEAKLRAAAQEWMAFLDEEPELCVLMFEFWTIWVRDEVLRARHAERYAAVRRYMGGLFAERADEMGVSLSLPAEQIGAVVVGLAYGLALQHLADPQALHEDLYPSVLALLIGALEQPASG
jgi:AcrR family transcriptional regulator